MCKRLLLLALLLLLVPPRLPAAAPAEAVSDDALTQARDFVRRSGRYLDYTQLRPGMTGYGLTVMQGTKLERFGATVVSVLYNWAPHQAVVLCRLSGLGLEKSGIISGMSGSPVFIRDPADGKDKLIGAVAYGWRFQTEPVCGIQPISQMLAIEGVPLPGRKVPKPTPPARASVGAVPDPGLVRALLDPRKVSFATFGAPTRPRPTRADPATTASRMVPLMTPVMICGARPRTLRLAESVLARTNLAAVQAGSVGGAQADAARDARIEPGSALSVQLIAGDADWAAVGTATEVIGDCVLAFGHAFDARGPVELPMGPAYVHTVIRSTYTSFKLGSTLKITGAVSSDEQTGVAGRVGKAARMVPMTVTVHWGPNAQTFHYQIVRHNWLTATMASMIMKDSLWSNRDLPELHALDYSVDIEFERLGKYRAANVSSGSFAWDVESDLTRPLAAMMNSRLGDPAYPKRIDVTIRVRGRETTASILALRLQQHTYRPGQTVRGRVTLRPFRADRLTQEVAVDLPKDLPDGEYTLTVCDAYDYLKLLSTNLPHRFEPRTVEQLFEGIRQVVGPRLDRLYLHFPLPDRGVAVNAAELEHLPSSFADVLARTAPIDTKGYRRSLAVDFETKYVISGSASAKFVVEEIPRRRQ